MVHPLRPPLRPFPKNGVSQMNRGPISRCVLSPGEYDTKYRQPVCCAGCHYDWAERCRLLQNYFGSCLVFLCITGTKSRLSVNRGDLWPNRPKVAQCVYDWGSAPDPGGGAYNAPPDSLVGWGGDPLPRQSLPSARRLNPRAIGARFCSDKFGCVVIFGNISSLRE